ncbi:MAG TPA: glycosyltransferase family 2 protein [Chryseosolibacter sp.]
MISVCIATKNGSRYVGEQLGSILSQLGPDDEVIISDDASTDKTIENILSLADPRIRILEQPNQHSIGIVANFERCLRETKGDLIFLADQDDVWLPNKVKKLSKHLTEFDLVISDCRLVDQHLQPLQQKLTKRHKMQTGLVRNLIHNSYMGCCMALRRTVLMKSLPFPKDIPMHDIWIGLVAELYFRVALEREPLVLHRRHEHNATTTGLPSQLSMRVKFANRYRILKNLILHKIYAG